MPVIVNQDTDQVVAFRCAKHGKTPQLNTNVHFDNGHKSECGMCCIDQGADALLGSIGELIDKAATRLDFFEPGTGQQLKEEAAQYFANLGVLTEMDAANPKENQK